MWARKGKLLKSYDCERKSGCGLSLQGRRLLSESTDRIWYMIVTMHRMASGGQPRPQHMHRLVAFVKNRDDRRPYQR